MFRRGVVMSNLERALEYASKGGYRVFPCIPGSKAPLCSNGCRDATTDPEQINKWWNATPKANIGISTDGLWVLDVDLEPHPWLTLEREQSLAAVPMSRTPRGGRHYVFRQFAPAQTAATSS